MITLQVTGFKEKKYTQSEASLTKTQYLLTFFLNFINLFKLIRLVPYYHSKKLHRF